MTWYHVGDETTVVPIYFTFRVDREKDTPYGPRVFTHEQLSNVPSGETVEVTHSIWRCGNCRAMACGAKGKAPRGPCQKCGARG